MGTIKNKLKNKIHSKKDVVAKKIRHLSNMGFISTYIANKKFLLLVGAVILALIPLVYTIFTSIKSGATIQPDSQISATPTPVSRNIDLTKGKITEFPNYFAGPYIEQGQEICNQQNLNAAFGDIIDPKVIQPKTFDALPKLYGETNWWYVTGGIISKIEQSSNNMIISLMRANTTVKFLVFPGKTNIGIDSGPQNSKRLAANDLLEGDSTAFYLTAKCGGNQPPQLAVQMILSTSFLDRLNQANKPK